MCGCHIILIWRDFTLDFCSILKGCLHILFFPSHLISVFFSSSSFPFLSYIFYRTFIFLPSSFILFMCTYLDDRLGICTIIIFVFLLSVVHIHDMKILRKLEINFSFFFFFLSLDCTLNTDIKHFRIFANIVRCI